jgi:hypothetical protein
LFWFKAQAGKSAAFLSSDKPLPDMKKAATKAAALWVNLLPVFRTV